MVTIKRPAQKKNGLLSGQNLFIAFVASQICAVIYVFGTTRHSQLPSSSGSLGHSLSTSLFQGGGASKSDEAPVEGGPSAGTHATSTGYYADYLYERENPAFRQESVPNWEASVDKVAALMPDVGKSLRSCQYLSDDHRLLTHAVCAKDRTTLVVYNSAPFERTWCDVKIAPHSAQKMPSQCKGPVKMLASDRAPITGTGMPPIVIKGEKDPKSPATAIDKCDIPCKQDKGATGKEVFIEGTDWKIFQTLDDPAKSKDANVERNAFRQDVYYSTSSFQSSVPLSHFSFDRNDLFTPAVSWDAVKPSGSYLIDRECVTQSSRRHRWEESISSRYEVASYGKCSHNTELPSGLTLDSKGDRVEIMRKHRFNMAFEVGMVKDHITNIVFEAFESGTLPIVLGASNLKEHFPLNSFISAGEFQTWEKLGIFVKEVMDDRIKWESYHAWRNDPEARATFEKKYNFTRTTPTCRMCRWAYAKKYGLGWDHEQQVVRKNAIPRDLCVDEKERMVTEPFRESWHTFADGLYQDIAAAGHLDLCYEKNLPVKSILEGSSSIDRQVFEHDGVVDIVFTKVPANRVNDLVLRLKFPVKNKGGAHFQDAHTLVPTVRGALFSSVAVQDSKVKITILANWETRVWSPSEGVVEVTIQQSGEGALHPDESRKIRVIVEDLVSLYDKVTEYYPSSYGKMMIQDFVDPLELFYVE
jgi:hypothetical protein